MSTITHARQKGCTAPTTNCVYNLNNKMKKEQRQIRNMLKRISASYKKNKDALVALVALSTLYDYVDQKIVIVDKLELDQKINSTGSTSQKNAYRTALLQVGFEVIASLTAYARDNSNEVLSADINFSETNLKSSSDDDLKNKMKIVLANASKYLEAASDYGLSSEKVTNFQERIKSFEDSIGIPKEIVIEHKGVTNQIGVELDQAMEKVKTIDLITNSIRYSNPKLYAEYESNRTLEKSVHTLSARVQVTDAVSREGIKDAKVVLELEGDPALDRRTAEKGGINFKTLEEGIYTVTVSKIGYVTQTVTFVVTDTESSYLEVLLSK